MILRRRSQSRALISLVPMIDVMLILLVFFMVTSTYRNLDMIPAIRPAEKGGRLATPAGKRLMIRIASDGSFRFRGTTLSATELQNLFATTQHQNALAEIIILPSGTAPTQALISAMDLAALAGMQNLRVLRLEALQ